MNRLLSQKTFCCFAAVLVTTLSYGQTQVTVAANHIDCPGDAYCPDPQASLPVQLAPAFEPAQVGIVSTNAGFALQESVETVKNQPYQAQAVTEMKQSLADGSHIVQTTTATVARDSDGRTARTQKLNAIGPWKSSDSSQGNSPSLTSIFDPVAKKHIDYTSDTKVAHVLPLPPRLSSDASTEVMASGFAVSSAAATVPAAPAMNTSGMNVMYSVQGRTKLAATEKADENTKTESLGTKTIEGVQVTGTRSTDTIAAGTIGNDKDIVVTHETWYSPDLKVVIQSTQSDPRFGETTYSLTNIQRNEPDETLFQVPAGYKIDKPQVFINPHQQ